MRSTPSSSTHSAEVSNPGNPDSCSKKANTNLEEVKAASEKLAKVVSALMEYELVKI